MTSTLPSPRLDLPEWDPQVRRVWMQRAQRAQRVTERAGTGKQFQVVLDEARRMLDAGEGEALISRLTARRFARAVVTAWRDDAELARRSMTPRLVSALRHAQSERPSRLTTITMTAILLEHFDRLESWQVGLFAEVVQAVRAAVARSPYRVNDVVETLRSEGAYLLDPQGPRTLARHLVSTGADFHGWLRSHHLLAYADGRFGRQARDAFYLVQIEDADPAQSGHDFLDVVSREVVARQKTESTADDGRYFGHAVLQEMLAKDVRRPTGEWLDAIVTIAGDPRHTSTPKWEAWWSKIDPRLITRAVRWMSGADLRAFLDGIEQYAHANAKDDMIRMLDRRKRLLEGLYEQDRVNDVRLILGSDIRNSIRRTTPLSTVDAPMLIDTGKQDTAVIYLDCGDFCIVEGSHVFKLHIYTREPVSELADRGVRQFHGDDLRNRIPARHRGGYSAFTHDVYGAWVRSALDFLRDEGVRLDEPALMTPEDYRALLNRRSRDRY